ncbi:DUF995 domain-containing protein [Ligilactobacillus acidipiscis]|uniref:DUF995 domain-containing protein n=1 Tax=Ligilactobacillus acidipiscis TaxID=89059 RepID=UPI0023F7CC67|nr:DUF995 domain-containing protein [Ligilactobacillus acidipiscis]WEV56166.1 DUF995 domain-containing protein [Ligilactobacillus acidipiscis]
MTEITPMKAAKQALKNQNKQGEIMVKLMDHMEQMEERVQSNTNQAIQSAKEAKNSSNEAKDLANEAKQLAKDNVDNVYLSRGQLRQVRKAVLKKSNQFAKTWISENHGKNYGGGDYFSKKIGQFRTAIWHELKERFDTEVCTEIRRIDYMNALSFTNSLAISSFESWRVKDRLKTLEILNKWEQSKGFPLTQPE